MCQHPVQHGTGALGASTSFCMAQARWVPAPSSAWHRRAGCQHPVLHGTGVGRCACGQAEAAHHTPSSWAGGVQRQQQREAFTQPALHRTRLQQGDAVPRFSLAACPSPQTHSPPTHLHALSCTSRWPWCVLGRSTRAHTTTRHRRRRRPVPATSHPLAHSPHPHAILALKLCSLTLSHTSRS